MQINQTENVPTKIHDELSFVESQDVAAGADEVYAYRIEAPDDYVIAVESGTPVAPRFVNVNGEKRKVLKPASELRGSGVNHQKVLISFKSFEEELIGEVVRKLRVEKSSGVVGAVVDRISVTTFSVKPALWLVLYACVAVNEVTSVELALTCSVLEVKVEDQAGRKVHRLDGDKFLRYDLTEDSANERKGDSGPLLGSLCGSCSCCLLN